MCADTVLDAGTMSVTKAVSIRVLKVYATLELISSRSQVGHLWDTGRNTWVQSPPLPLKCYDISAVNGNRTSM